MFGNLGTRGEREKEDKKVRQDEKAKSTREKKAPTGAKNKKDKKSSSFNFFLLTAGRASSALDPETASEGGGSCNWEERES